MKTWLITGASSGLGKGIAEAVLSHGDCAAITARDAKKLKGFAERYGKRVLPLSLEVTDPAQRHDTVAKTLEAFGHIDILVNNAGRGHSGAVEDSVEEDVRLLFETNFFGPVGMIREVLPSMRAAGSGLIINTSSMGVMFENGLGNAYYTASKAALEKLSAVLANEVAPFGIHVTILEPGAFRTEFRVSSISHEDTQMGVYAATVGASRKKLADSPYSQPGDPAKAGEAIYEAAGRDEVPSVLVLGKNMVETECQTLEHRKEEILRWKDLSDSTDF